jgi:hypothetical protein
MKQDKAMEINEFQLETFIKEQMPNAYISFKYLEAMKETGVVKGDIVYYITTHPI